eukprot:jgi/Bigna1/76762/fgenesh1_pg.43_\
MPISAPTGSLVEQSTLLSTMLTAIQHAVCVKQRFHVEADEESPLWSPSRGRPLAYKCSARSLSGTRAFVQCWNEPTPTVGGNLLVQNSVYGKTMLCPLRVLDDRGPCQCMSYLCFDHFLADSSCDWTLFEKYVIFGLDLGQLAYHLLMNYLTVHIINTFLERTFCEATIEPLLYFRVMDQLSDISNNEGQLLACCDPFNWSITSLFPCCVWLWGHFFAYMYSDWLLLECCLDKQFLSSVAIPEAAGKFPKTEKFFIIQYVAPTGYSFGKNSTKNHINLLICQLVWFYSEYYTYIGTYREEVERYHIHPEFGRHTSALPCGNVVYYSTWVPIWEDYIYNTLGQISGYLLFAYYLKKAQKKRPLLLIYDTASLSEKRRRKVRACDIATDFAAAVYKWC